MSSNQLTAAPLPASSFQPAASAGRIFVKPAGIQNDTSVFLHPEVPPAEAVGHLTRRTHRPAAGSYPSTATWVHVELVYFTLVSILYISPAFTGTSRPVTHASEKSSEARFSTRRLCLPITRFLLSME